MLKIAPSILSADFSRLAEEVRAIEEAGCDYLHLDVMDGRFVPQITIGQPVVSAIGRVASRPLDVHLMVEDPDLQVESFVKAGAGIVTVHLEACRHIHRTLGRIRSLGARAGLSLNPGTSLAALEWLLGEVDLVLVMSVNPGFAGQAFIPASLERIRRVREMLDRRGLSAEVEVDGGVVLDNIAEVAAAGADVVVSGSGVFRTPDYAATIRGMREAAHAIGR